MVVFNRMSKSLVYKNFRGLSDVLHFPAGTATPPINKVSIGRRSCLNLNDIEVIVHINQNIEDLPPMSVFQDAAAFSDRRDICWFVLRLRLIGNAFLRSIGGYCILRACSRRLHRWVHFGGQGAARLRCHGRETDMPFIRMQEESAYESRSTRTLRRILRAILDEDRVQNIILLHVGQCFFGYPFSTAWFATCCEHF